MQQIPTAPVFAADWQKHPPHAPLQTHSSNHGPPPDGSNGPKAMTGTTQQIKPEVFDLTIGDTVMEVKRDTERELVEYARRRRQKQMDVAGVLANHLGPSHINSANPSYVDTLVRQTTPAATAYVKNWNEWKTGQLPPQPEFADGWNKWLTGKVPESSPGGEPASSSGTVPSGSVPSGIGAKHEATSGKTVKALTTRQTPYGNGSGKGKGNLVLHMQPGPPETPAGMAPPPNGKPPPSGGRGRIKKAEKAAEPKVKGKFLRASGEKMRATLKAARDLKANSAPKMNPTPIPEKQAPPPATKQGLAATAAETRANKKLRLNGKQPAEAPAVAPAPARAKSRSASRTKGAASSSSGVASGPTPAPAPTQRVGAGPMAKRPPSAAKAEPTLDVVVAPAAKRPARGRSSSATPQAAPAEPPARSKSRAKSAAAAEQPADTPLVKFKPASRLLVSEIAGKILEAVKIDGFNREDAAEAAKLLKQLEGAGRREATPLQDKLRGLYQKNYKAMKSWEARQKA